jgi:hypothetical protein
MNIVHVSGVNVALAPFHVPGILYSKSSSKIIKPVKLQHSGCMKCIIYISVSLQ